MRTLTVVARVLPMAMELHWMMPPLQLCVGSRRRACGPCRAPPPDQVGTGPGVWATRTRQEGAGIAMELYSQMHENIPRLYTS